MNGKDYYQILGVERDALPQKIKEAYRRLAFQYHPDRNIGNPSALEKMKEINEAYAVLSDPGKRKDFDTMQDRFGSYGYDRFKETYSEQDIFRGSDINQIFEEMGRAFGFRGFDEVFRESYGQSYRTFEFRRPGLFARGFVFFGPGSQRKYQPEISTPSGIVPGYLGRLTQHLLRRMLGIKSPGRGKDWYDVIRLDLREAQDGGKIKYLHRRKSKELMITIPHGIKEGKQIRLMGMGGPGKEGGEPGDLYLKVKIRTPLLEKIIGFLKIV
jgi:DnaJ-class molecular chaperone